MMSHEKNAVLSMVVFNVVLSFHVCLVFVFVVSITGYVILTGTGKNNMLIHSYTITTSWANSISQYHGRLSFKCGILPVCFPAG